MQRSDHSRAVSFRRARVDDRDAVLHVLAFANMHYVPSAEMPELALDKFHVAVIGGRVVGCSGFTVLPDGRGKTTLMAVDPTYRGLGVGQRLQEIRMIELRSLGCKVVITNADRPETIDWYKRKFGYREIGSLKKVHEFGDPAVDHWTTLEADIERWFNELYVPGDGDPRTDSAT
jgi:N-acetylglutamate synthase-like GNAT family acetyltransferase